MSRRQAPKFSGSALMDLFMRVKENGVIEDFWKNRCNTFVTESNSKEGKE